MKTTEKPLRWSALSAGGAVAGDQRGGCEGGGGGGEVGCWDCGGGGRGYSLAHGVLGVMDGDSWGE